MIVLGSSVDFDGTDYIHIPYDTRLCDFGNFDWTMEMFVKFHAYPGSEQALFAFGNGGGIQSPYLLCIARPQSDGTVVFSIEEASNQAGLWQASSPHVALDTSKWYHICGERYNNTIKMYVNGLNDTAAGANTWYNAGWDMVHQTGMELDIATLHYGNQGFSRRINAVMSNMRITKGSALYRGNFTPPKSKLNVSQNTVLLALNSETLIDAGPYNWPLDPQGTTPTVVSVSAFG
jgi:hypothetical protein